MGLFNVNIKSIDKITSLDFLFNMNKNKTNGYVCFLNVHMLMEAYNSKIFSSVVNNAALILPDGAPIAWAITKQKKSKQERISGPELMLDLCERAEKEKKTIGFYGGSVDVLENLNRKIKSKYPKLHVVYSYSPPFRELDHYEKELIISDINCKSPDFLFVGLGCPKQEKWMNEYIGCIDSILLGVGAAFDFHAGNKKIAPTWMKNIGLEWFYRLLQDPKRLWKRYLKYNTQFIYVYFFKRGN